MFFAKSSNDNHDLTKVAALLIHAAKIDENYTSLEKEIIKKTLLKIGANEENIDNMVNEGEKIEKNSVQILEFTKEVKSLSESNKILIVETLWKIIYSNLEDDVYETSLMRRLAGLLYIDNKIMGDIKEKIKKNL